MATKTDKSPKPKKPAAKPAPQKKALASKPVAQTSVQPAARPSAPDDSVAKKSVAPKKVEAKSSERKPVEVRVPQPRLLKPEELTGFAAKQYQRLLNLKDTLLDSMSGVAKDNLRSRAEGSEASAFGMHQADAGSDAYDRDFALSLLSQEQDSLYEIDEALKRILTGAYGICEMSNKPIPHQRLEVLPFTRYTVECQAEIEKRNRYSRVRQPVTSLFGLNDDEGSDGDDDDTNHDTKD